MFYQTTVTLPITRLQGLLSLLDKVESQAAEKGISEETILSGKLANDMFSFVKQIQIASDNAKGMASRMARKEAPKYEDNETTLKEVRARIEKTISYLETFTPEDFADAATAEAKFPWFAGVKFVGEGYVLTYGIPNFMFHIVTAYDILRHLGFDIGKADYMGPGLALVPDAE
jgi:hypothetical protein